MAMVDSVEPVEQTGADVMEHVRDLLLARH